MYVTNVAALDAESTHRLLAKAGLSESDLTDGVEDSEAEQMVNAIATSADLFGESTIYMIGLGGEGFRNTRGASGIADLRTGRVAITSWYSPVALVAHELLHCFGIGHVTGDHFMAVKIPAAYLPGAYTGAESSLALPLNAGMIAEVADGPGCGGSCRADWGEWKP